MASLNCREGSWPMGFLGTRYSVSVLTTLITVTLTRTSSTLTEEMKMHRHSFTFNKLFCYFWVISELKFETLTTVFLNFHFRYLIKHDQEWKLWKKIIFFRVLFFKLFAVILEILLTYVCLFPRTFIHNVSVSSKNCMYCC